jgi:multiple sugar transport system ATP-binding protein
MRSSARVNEAAEILGITDLLDRKPRQLSGGQRQRVAVGRAIVREPKVFLFDEPLSNLDAKLRVQMRAEISKLHQRLKTTFIYVTHDQTEAMTMASRIAVINKGIMQQLDTPQNLYDHPSNLFVAGFIGSPAMNFFPAKIAVSGGKVMVDMDDFQVQIPDALGRPLQRHGRQTGGLRHTP